jgi:hypothetical protein
MVPEKQSRFKLLSLVSATCDNVTTVSSVIPVLSSPLIRRLGRYLLVIKLEFCGLLRLELLPLIKQRSGDARILLLCCYICSKLKATSWRNIPRALRAASLQRLDLLFISLRETKAIGFGQGNNQSSLGSVAWMPAVNGWTLDAFHLSRLG